MNTQNRRTIIDTNPDGSETIEDLGSDSLVFRDKNHMLRALVSGSLGQEVAQTMASHACLMMAAEAENQLKRMRRPEVTNALDAIRAMNPDELHALSSAAYQELCVRARRSLRTH